MENVAEVIEHTGLSSAILMLLVNLERFVK
jgi:hypothetical protein